MIVAIVVVVVVFVRRKCDDNHCSGNKTRQICSTRYITVIYTRNREELRENKIGVPRDGSSGKVLSDH